MGRQTAAMQQADHDLLIEIRTQLRTLMDTTAEHTRSTQSALAAKADLADVATLSADLKTKASDREVADLRVTVGKQDDKIQMLQRIVFIGLGGIIAIEALFKWVIPAVQLIARP